MKKIIYLLAVLIAASLSSCELLPLQTNEKYRGEALDPHTGLSCMQYIESMPELFSNLREAIAVCGLEDYYTQTSEKLTYLLLTNTAILPAEVESAKINAADRTKLRNDLLFHIVQGYYHGYGTLNYDPIFVVTMYESPNAIMTLKLETHISDRNQEGTLKAMDQTGSSVVTCVSSNYFFTNGVGHIFNARCRYQ